MDLNKAILILSKVTYKPGWSFEWEVPTFLGITSQNMLVVKVRVETVDSDTEYAPDYKKPIMAGDNHVFDVNKYPDHIEFLYALLQFIMMIELHEAREFLAIGSEYIKPFHPHTKHGEVLWTALGGTAEW